MKAFISLLYHKLNPCELIYHEAMQSKMQSILLKTQNIQGMFPGRVITRPRVPETGVDCHLARASGSVIEQLLCASRRWGQRMRQGSWHEELMLEATGRNVISWSRPLRRCGGLVNAGIPQCWARSFVGANSGHPP